MTTATAHTPGPYYTNGRALMIHGAERQQLAVPVARDKKRAMADRDFIRDACNSHADLLEAHNHIRKVADFNKDDGAFDLGERLLDIERTARAAIAKTLKQGK